MSGAPALARGAATADPAQPVGQHHREVQNATRKPLSNAYDNWFETAFGESVGAAGSSLTKAVGVVSGDVSARKLGRSSRKKRRRANGAAKKAGDARQGRGDGAGGRNAPPGERAGAGAAASKAAPTSEAGDPAGVEAGEGGAPRRADTRSDTKRLREARMDAFVEKQIERDRANDRAKQELQAARAAVKDAIHATAKRHSLSLPALPHAPAASEYMHPVQHEVSAGAESREALRAAAQGGRATQEGQVRHRRRRATHRKQQQQQRGTDPATRASEQAAAARTRDLMALGKLQPSSTRAPTARSYALSPRGAGRLHRTRARERGAEVAPPASAPRPTGASRLDHSPLRHSPPHAHAQTQAGGRTQPRARAREGRHAGSGDGVGGTGRSLPPLSPEAARAAIGGPEAARGAQAGPQRACAGDYCFTEDDNVWQAVAHVLAELGDPAVAPESASEDATSSAARPPPGLLLPALSRWRAGQGLGDASTGAASSGDSGNLGPGPPPSSEQFRAGLRRKWGARSHPQHGADREEEEEEGEEEGEGAGATGAAATAQRVRAATEALGQWETRETVRGRRFRLVYRLVAQDRALRAHFDVERHSEGAEAPPPSRPSLRPRGAEHQDWVHALASQFPLHRFLKARDRARLYDPVYVCPCCYVVYTNLELERQRILSLRRREEGERAERQRRERRRRAERADRAKAKAKERRKRSHRRRGVEKAYGAALSPARHPHAGAAREPAGTGHSDASAGEEGGEGEAMLARPAAEFWGSVYGVGASSPARHAQATAVHTAAQADHAAPARTRTEARSPPRPAVPTNEGEGEHRPSAAPSPPRAQRSPEASEGGATPPQATALQKESPGSPAPATVSGLPSYVYEAPVAGEGSPSPAAVADEDAEGAGYDRTHPLYRHAFSVRDTGGGAAAAARRRRSDPAHAPEQRITDLMEMEGAVGGGVLQQEIARMECCSRVRKALRRGNRLTVVVACTPPSAQGPAAGPSRHEARAFLGNVFVDAKPFCDEGQPDLDAALEWSGGDSERGAWTLSLLPRRVFCN